jgi:L-asparaginase
MSAKVMKKCVVLATGGTIAGLAVDRHDNLGYVAGQLGVEALMAQVLLPSVASGAESGVDSGRTCVLVTEQVAQIDSKDMDYAVWRQLLERILHHQQDDSVQGIVITHGTDTIEETACFLALTMAHWGTKPVVLTCAMRPATAAAPDGPQNLADACAVACDPLARGVLVVCAGAVHGAMHVQKVHPYRLDAFASGEAGPLAVVEERRVRWLHPASWITGFDLDFMASDAQYLVARNDSWPCVELVYSHVNSHGLWVDLLLQAGSVKIQGLIVAATGNGTVHAALDAALLRAQAAGVLVWRSTRCALGQVLTAQGACPALPAVTLSPVKARIAMTLHLMQRHKRID